MNVFLSGKLYLGFFKFICTRGDCKKIVYFSAPVFSIIITNIGENQFNDIFNDEKNQKIKNQVKVIQFLDMYIYRDIFF